MSNFHESWLPALLLTGTLAACGGGGAPSAGDAENAAETPPAQSVTASAVVVFVDENNASIDNSISVTGYELVSSTRVSRTVFDYTYRAELQVEGTNYPSGATLTVRSSAAGTAVQDGSITTGPLLAFSIETPEDTFTIRQDRTVPFDPTALIWSGSGDAAPEPPAELELLTFDFVTERGRSGHEALLPIQARPTVGPQTVFVEFSVPVTGTLVRLTDASGVPTADFILDPRDSTEPITAGWFGTVSVPGTPFRAKVVAIPVSGAEQTFPIDGFVIPSQTSVTITPGSLTLTTGESAVATVSLTNVSAANMSMNLSVTTVAGLIISPAGTTVPLDAEGKGTVELTITAGGFTEGLPVARSVAISIDSPGSARAATALDFDIYVYPTE